MNLQDFGAGCRCFGNCSNAGLACVEACVIPKQQSRAQSWVTHNAALHSVLACLPAWPP